MQNILSFDILIYYVILGVSLTYIYRAVKQIITKDIEFYKQEIYTDESVERWATVDGILKSATALVCIVYAILSLTGSESFLYVIVAFAVNIVLYLVLYKKILVRKDSN